MLQYIPVAYKAGMTVGTTITSSASSQNIPIPVDATGNNPKRVVCVSTSSVHVRFCSSTGTAATAGDLMITTTPMVLDVSGNQFFAVIQEGAASKITVSPVEQ